MACKHWKDEWVARLYEELEPAEERAVTAHLETCAGCRENLDALILTRRALQASAAMPLPAARVVVLGRTRSWRWTWTFATGVACGAAVFALGFLAGPRWAGRGASPSSVVVPAPAGALPAARRSPAPPPEMLRALETRLAALERGGSARAVDDNSRSVTHEQLGQDLARLERRFDRARADDVRFLLQSITATELRAGTWIDETRDALNYLALKQDPRLSEQ